MKKLSQHKKNIQEIFSHLAHKEFSFYENWDFFSIFLSGNFYSLSEWRRKHEKHKRNANALFSFPLFLKDASKIHNQLNHLSI